MRHRASIIYKLLAMRLTVMWNAAVIVMTDTGRAPVPFTVSFRSCERVAAWSWWPIVKLVPTVTSPRAGTPGAPAQQLGAHRRRPMTAGFAAGMPGSLRGAAHRSTGRGRSLTGVAGDCAHAVSPDQRKVSSHSAAVGTWAAGTRIAVPGCREVFAAAAPLPNVGGGRYGAGMPNQPDPDSPPSPGRPPPGRRPPGQPTPHDSIFRQVFGVPANAASQLRAVLPPAAAQDRTRQPPHHRRAAAVGRAVAGRAGPARRE
jgi:hypothetical protein